ncbi:MAG: dipeptidase [Hellea sp.]
MRNITIGLLALSLGACQAASINEEVKPAVTLDAAAIHAQTLTLDTHIDIPLTYMDEIDPSKETELQVDIPKLAAGELDSGFWIIYTPQGELTADGYASGMKIAQKRLNAIKRFTRANSDRVEAAKTASDVRRIVEQGKHAVIIGMENAYPIGEDVDLVEVGAQQGVRYMGITHFGHNQFGDSSNPNPLRDDGPKWNGLSPLGKSLVKTLNDHGIMVDVSHAGKETMMQAADISRTPIIASHSGVKAIADSARNLDDEQLLKLKEVGGVVQIVALGAYVKAPTAEQKAYEAEIETTFNVKTSADVEKLSAEDKAKLEEARAKLRAMSPPANVADFVNHIDHAVKVAGIDHVGIASDFDGGGGIVGWKDASETANVTAELVKRGYSQDDIAKIWGANLLRVMEAAEKGAM